MTQHWDVFVAVSWSVGSSVLAIVTPFFIPENWAVPFGFILGSIAITVVGRAARSGRTGSSRT